MFQEDQDYEFNARYDSVSEAFAGTALDQEYESESDRYFESLNDPTPAEEVFVSQFFLDMETPFDPEDV